jgi:hypothetical protein
MDFRDSLSVQLPSRRDDEPPSLRQDILDELADHLACAYKRELLRGADSGTAQVRVLERFGNPAHVARRLWFDAMKGKIMTQRMLIAACLLLVVLCGVALTLVRQQAADAQRQVAEANAQLAHALAQSQAANQEMLKQLRQMAEAVQPGQSPDWIPVSFKLTQETLDGPPAVGFEATLGRNAEGMADRVGMGLGQGRMEYPPLTEVIHRVSDQNGEVDFGVVRPGDWQFDLVRKYNGQKTWHSRGSLNVLPGKRIAKSIVCPKSPPETEPVTIRVAWPADLAAKEYLIEASFTHAGASYRAPLHWTLGPNPNVSWGLTRPILCGPREGEIRRTDLGRGPTFYYWQFSDPLKGMVDLGREKSNPNNLFADLRHNDAHLELSAAVLEVGKYNLHGLVVMRSRPPHQLKEPAERFDVLAYAASSQFRRLSPLTINTVFKPPDEDPAYPYPQSFGMTQGWGGGRGQPEPAAKKRVAVSESYWIGSGAQFAVQRGSPNAWTIQLPDEIVNVLRNELEVGDSAKAKPG